MEFQEVADIFKVLSDANRVKILSIIHENGEVCVCKIQEQFNITQPTLSYHMKLLQDVNLISCRKIGTSCHYKLNDEMIKKVSKYLIDFK